MFPQCSLVFWCDVQDSAIVNPTHTPNRAGGFRPKFRGADGKPTPDKTTFANETKTASNSSIAIIVNMSTMMPSVDDDAKPWIVCTSAVTVLRSVPVP